MLEHISWTNYFTVVVLLLVAYYLILAITCYRPEISSLVSGLGRKQVSSNEAADMSADEIATASSHVIETIHGILESSGQGADKAELIARLRLALSGYAGMRYPAYRNAVTDYIIREAKAICGVGISARDLEG
jgi:hypothetical protein